MLAVLLVAAALATLPGAILKWDYSWDRLLFRDQLFNNRMAPNTAVNFLLVGIALFLLNLPSRTARLVTQSLALAAGFVSLLTVLGYAYGEPSLSGIGAYIRMALNTALLDGLLCAGILCAHPDQGLMAVFTSDAPGGGMRADSCRPPSPFRRRSAG